MAKSLPTADNRVLAVTARNGTFCHLEPNVIHSSLLDLCVSFLHILFVPCHPCTWAMRPQCETSKYPVGGISVVTLIRTDTTVNLYHENVGRILSLDPYPTGLRFEIVL